MTGCILGGTDKGHLTLTWKYGIKECNKNYFGKNFRKFKYDYISGDYLSFSNYLKEVNWDKTLEHKSVQECYSGRDEVSPNVLKNCSDQISVILLIIFKKSFSEGVVPREWSEANVTPLFKKGSRLDS